ncbi:MAG: beta-ketoacyl-ACP synthase II [Parcubacteria group bacterium]
MEKRRIVITGIGMITPLGNSAMETWENLIKGKSGIGPLTRFKPDDYQAGPDFPRIAGEVKDFDLTEWKNVDKKLARRMDPFIQFIMAAAIEAVGSSGINLKEENSFRIGVEIGSGLGGVSTWEEQSQILFKEGVEAISPFLIPLLIANMAPGNLSIFFGAKGPSIATVTACASGAHAIGEAFEKIKSGRADLMITGGTEAALTPLGFGGFNKMRALSRRNDAPEKASRPFDKDRDGFVMAEGAGAMVLEELQHALARKAEIYGEIIGFGMTSDAFHITQPTVEGPKECMRLAIEEAGIKPEEIGYINAHGTSTSLNDETETRAIKTVFDERAYKIPVSSTKSMTGHLLGAAGAVEAIITTLALREGIIPPTINLDSPDPECDLDYVPNQARKKEVQYALSNSFGFGGTNACLVFKKHGERAI